MTGLSSQNIRDLFSSFFGKHGHKKISSSPLIPQNDPSLLFVNAGMNQFKDYFTGKAVPTNKRAISIQKCLRAGGKHNDLDNVGLTARHHTFFEMLGNFSFADYFKKEAIDYAWAFLTKELDLPKDKLYITVHKSDREAFRLWCERGVPRERIFYRGDQDNFWEMGDTGPCGPCSEVFYDHGEQYNSNGRHDSSFLLADENRYVEIWNLVFMQYEKYEEDGVIKTRSLPNPSVDTGIGLERLTAVMQGVYWNYDTDLFLPIVEKIKNLSQYDGQDLKVVDSFRIIADHVRSSTMLITDGVVPSNEGRGYVLRRIIRRALRHVKKLQADEDTLPQLVETVFSILGHEYPQNQQGLDAAKKTLEIEGNKFFETLDQGMSFLNKSLQNDVTNKTLGGDIIFKLYDTFGFPPDLTTTILNEKGLMADMEGFNTLMEDRRRDSRKSWKKHAVKDNRQFHAVLEKYGKTQFLGYTSLRSTSTLLDVIKFESNTKGLVFDKTPFYGESGGQEGDRGLLKEGDKTICSIEDVERPIPELFVHFVSSDTFLKKGESYTLEVDEKRRSATAKNHSATHLLQSALRKVLGSHVQQAGSGVSNTKLRFDFVHPKALTNNEILLVEKMVNAWIREGLPVLSQNMNMDKALEQGAIAFFEDKYEDPVRVLTMGDASIELCGGTHVGRTSDITIFKIIHESSLASGIRRIEAITDQTAIDYLMDRSLLLESLENKFQSKGSALVKKMDSLQEDLKLKVRQIKKIQSQIQSEQLNTLFDRAQKINGVHFLMTEISRDHDLKVLSDSFTSTFSQGIALFYVLRENSFNVLLRCTKNLSLDCSTTLKNALQLANGKGGGRADRAQGSGRVEHLKLFLSKIESVILDFCNSSHPKQKSLLLRRG